jgi:hypothetical protein
MARSTERHLLLQRATSDLLLYHFCATSVTHRPPRAGNPPARRGMRRALFPAGDQRIGEDIPTRGLVFTVRRIAGGEPAIPGPVTPIGVRPVRGSAKVSVTRRNPGVETTLSEHKTRHGSKSGNKPLTESGFSKMPVSSMLTRGLSIPRPTRRKQAWTARLHRPSV